MGNKNKDLKKFYSYIDFQWDIFKAALIGITVGVIIDIIIVILTK